ncbi:MAG TPA: protein kinase, partial [Planctomycetaceae bacterium]
EGTVEIRTGGESGPHVIDRAGPGEVLGEMALVTAEPRSADVVALDAVRARVLPVDAFHRLAARHPVLWDVLTDLIAERLGAVPRDALAGKVFHGYRICRRLGRGGMAVVYEAGHLETGRRVALKMMSHRLVSDPAALALFRREADLIEAFDHPHIVRMFGRFEAFRTYFIVLQFVEGETLARMIASDGPLPPDRAKRILGQLAGALAYAHAAGVVHRDVKPANVMMTPDGGAKLMDFGLALRLEESPSETGRTIVGTPRYMAPEQLMGRPVDRAADYFAFGCVAYEVLTGRPLLPESDPRKILEHVRSRAGTRISESPACAGDPAWRLLDGCLVPDPRHRRLDLETVAAWA